MAGTLGGSQAGLRIGYRLNDDAARPLALAGRLYLPLEHPTAGEAAFGLEWKPWAGVPLRLLVEQRLDIGGHGRSDTAVMVHGGIDSLRLPLGARVEAYAQAGLVGLSERDPFADGAARLSLPLGPVEVGAGAWAAAQPGASRVDVGPQMSIRLPVEGANLRLLADWRFRIAGHAEPASGPSLTLATDF